MRKYMDDVICMFCFRIHIFWIRKRMWLIQSYLNVYRGRSQGIFYFKLKNDVYHTVVALLVTVEQAKEIVGLKVLHDKKIYENEKLGINDYIMNPDTKMTKADIEKFEKDKGNIEEMSREEVLEDDVKTLSSVKSVKKPPAIRISPYWNHGGCTK